VLLLQLGATLVEFKLSTAHAADSLVAFAHLLLNRHALQLYLVARAQVALPEDGGLLEEEAEEELGLGSIGLANGRVRLWHLHGVVVCP
jgi:hypothetical protein